LNIVSIEAKYVRSPTWLGPGKRDEELQELWDRCGDHEAMFWEPGMHRPALIADFETEEAE
jgi:hypothetical protein